MARYLIACLVLASVAASGAEPRAQAETDRPVGKVAVSARGDVTYDGVAVTLEVLGEKLADLRKRNGAVWYYREAAGGAPPERTVHVMRLVAQSALPISISTKPDYSDVLLPDGTTRPRAGVPSR